MPEETTENGGAPAKKGGGSKKIAILALGVMLIETIGVGAFIFLSRGGSSANAMGLEGKDGASEKTAEILLVDTTFQNLSRDRVWDWQTKIFLKVRVEHQEFVEQRLEQRRAEVLTEIATIFRQAQHSQLKEPGMQTITRQVAKYLDTVFGEDPEGEPYIQRVLVPKCDGYPADF
ncbi:MAG: hypothetical protein ACF8SC_11685 [Phycisphaerales bacterium JB037]